MIKVAGIIRKSPTKKGVEESVDIQKDAIIRWCDSKFGFVGYDIDFFIDKDISGDDPNRPELKKFFNSIIDYDYAVAMVVDRYVRSHIGLNWFFEYFAPADGVSVHSGCKLFFVEGCPNLYDSENYIIGTNVAVFGMFCLMGYSELLNIRKRTARGRDKLRNTPLWSEKYKGGKVGRKWKTKSPKSRRWSAEDIAELVILKDEGLSTKRIAEKLGRTERAIILKFGRI